jgi:hypothetical protein
VPVAVPVELLVGVMVGFEEALELTEVVVVREVLELLVAVGEPDKLTECVELVVTLRDTIPLRVAEEEEVCQDVLEDVLVDDLLPEELGGAL